MGGEMFTTLKQFASSPRTDVEVLDSECCSDLCSLNLTRFDILFTRAKIWTQLDRTDSKNLKTLLKSAVSEGVVSDNGTACLSFRVNGKPCCIKLLSLILHVNIDKIIKWSEDLSNGLRTAEHGNRGTLRIQDKTMADLTKASMKIDSVSQPHPSGHGLMMPAGTIQKDVFSSEFMSRKTPVRLSLIKQYTSLDIRFRKASRFLSCNTCSSISSWISRRSLEELKDARRVQRAHWEEVQQERLALSNLDTKSRHRPDEILVMKGDGMSRLGTKLPCIPERAKRISDTSRQTCDLYGWQAARKGDTSHEFRNFYYINPFNSYNCALNFYMSSLVHALGKVGGIPPILYLVLDSASVNKSKFMHGSLAYLMLKLPSLQKIVCLHARVGHTHNSIDGSFGQIRKVIAREELFSPQALAAAASQVGCSESYLPVVYEFKNMLDGHLTDIKNRCSQFGFEITRSTENIYLSGFECVTETLNDDSERFKIPIFKSKTHMITVSKVSLESIQPNVESVKRSVKKILDTCDKLVPDDEKLLLNEMIVDIQNMTPGPCDSLFSSISFANGATVQREEEEDPIVVNIQNELIKRGYHSSARGQHKQMIVMDGKETEENE